MFMFYGKPFLHRFTDLLTSQISEILRNRRPHLAVWHTQTALPPGPQLRLLPVDWAGPQGFRPERIWEPSVDTMMYVYGNTCIHLIMSIYVFMYGIWARLKMVALWKSNENDDDTLKSGGFSRFSVAPSLFCSEPPDLHHLFSQCTTMSWNKLPSVNS
jgi:hypothetical protein